MGVYVVVSQGQARAHDAFGCICELDVVKQELVDGARGLAAFPELLHVCENLRVIGRVGAHDCRPAGVVKRDGEEEVKRGRCSGIFHYPRRRTGLRFADHCNQRQQRETARTPASAGIDATFSSPFILETVTSR